LPNGYVEALDLAVVTDATLKQTTVVSKDISLTDHTESETIKDRLRNRFPAVRNRVNTATRLSRDLIRVLAIAEAQSRVSDEHFTLRRQR
jgi:hypothetical protein